MGKRKDPLPNITRKVWPPGEFHRSSEDPPWHEDNTGPGIGRRWDGRVKRMDMYGDLFSPTFNYPESITNDGHGEKPPQCATPKPRASHRTKRNYPNSLEDY